MQHNYRIMLTIIIIIMSFSLPFDVLAEDGGDIRKHSIASGAWAVQFAVRSYVTLDTFGGMFSIKYHLSDPSAIRLGMGYTQSYEITDPINSGVYSYESNHKEYDYTVSLAYVNYPMLKRNVILYWGIGPEFGYYLKERYYQFSSYSETQYSIGALGILGFEWFATKEISLHAEYQPIVYYSDISGHSDNRDDSYTGYGWYADTNRVLFGLSAYF